MDQFLRILSPGRDRPLPRAPDVRPEGDTHPAPNRELQRPLVLIPKREDLPIRIVRDVHLRTEGDQSLQDVPGGDEDRFLLDHLVHGLLVQVGPVLDRAAARAEGGHDARLAMAVRRDEPLRPRRLSDDGLELVVRELLMDRAVHFAHDPAWRARFASATARAVRTGKEVFAMSSTLVTRMPMKCPWQSHMPGMTTGTRWTRMSAGAFGAFSMGPANVIVGPSIMTQPFWIGSPRPGIKRSASMRSMTEGNASARMRIGYDPPSIGPKAILFAGHPFPARESTMAPGQTGSNFRAVAKHIIDDHRSFDPSGSAASGLHRFDGVLPDYSGASVRGYTARARDDLKALDRIARSDSLSRSARLAMGVLRGMLLSELSELEDQRLPRAFPFYFLVRLSIVNYLLRNYAPLDRRLRSVGKLQAQVPAFLKSLRGTIDRRLADTCYEMAEMAAAGILDAYSRGLPE